VLSDYGLQASLDAQWSCVKWPNYFYPPKLKTVLFVLKTFPFLSLEFVARVKTDAISIARVAFVKRLLKAAAR